MFPTDYKEDKRACSSINKLLGTNFLAVYRHTKKYKDQYSAKDFSIDCEMLYIRTQDGRLLEMLVSEWLSINEVNHDQNNQEAI